MPPKIRLTQEQCASFIQEYKERLERGESTIINPITQKNIKIYPYDELTENHMAYKILEHCSSKHSLTLETCPTSASRSTVKTDIRTKKDAINHIKKDISVFTNIPSNNQISNPGNLYSAEIYTNAVIRIIISCYNLIANLYDYKCDVKATVLDQFRESWMYLEDLIDIYMDNAADHSNAIYEIMNVVRHYVTNMFRDEQISMRYVSIFIDVLQKHRMPHEYIKGAEKANVLAYVPILPRPKRLSFFTLDLMFNDLLIRGMNRSVNKPPYMFLLQYYSQDDMISAICTLMDRISRGSEGINSAAVDRFMQYFMKHVLQEFKHTHSDNKINIGFPNVSSYFTRKLLSEDIASFGLNSHYFTKTNVNSFFLKKNLNNFKEGDDMRYSEFNQQILIQNILDHHKINLGLSQYALSREIEYIHLIDSFDDCNTVRTLIEYFRNPEKISQDAFISALDTIHNNIEELYNENTHAFVVKLMQEFLCIDQFQDRMKPYFMIFGSFVKNMFDGNHVGIYCALIADIFHVDIRDIVSRDGLMRRIKSMSFIHHAGLYEGMANRDLPDNFSIIENLTLVNLYCVFKMVKVKKIYTDLFHNMLMLSGSLTKEVNQRMYQYYFVFDIMRSIHEQFMDFDYSEALGFNKKTSLKIQKEFQQGLIIQDYSPSSSSLTGSELQSCKEIIDNINIVEMKGIPKEYKSYLNKMIKVSKAIHPQTNCNKTNLGIYQYIYNLYKTNMNNYETISAIRGKEFEQAYSILLSVNRNVPPSDIFNMLKKIKIVYNNERGLDYGGLWNEFYTNVAQQLMALCFKHLDDSDKLILKEKVTMFDSDIDHYIIGIILAILITFNIKLNGKLSYNLILYLLATDNSNDDSMTYLKISRNYQSILYMLDTDNINYIKLFNYPIDEINMFIGTDTSSSRLETPADYIKHINKTIKESLAFDSKYFKEFKRGFNKIIDPIEFKQTFGNEPLVLFNLSESISLAYIKQDDIKNILLKKQDEYLRDFIHNRQYDATETTSALSILEKYKSIIEHTDNYEYLPSESIEELKKIYPNVPTNYEQFINAFMFHISGFKSIRSDLPYKLVCSRFNNGIEYHTCFYSIDIPITLSGWTRQELLYLIVSDVSASNNNIA